MLLTLLPTAFAAGSSGGLAAFTDKKQYAAGTFQDVDPAAWYAASVQTVYAKGIMDGVGGGRFEPGRTMPWSQAVTIAARLHAACRGRDIPAADGAWYAQYLNYARDSLLLPAICPEEGALDSTPITREGLAVLFRSVLDEADLPAINDQTIPDLDRVRPEYRDTVSQMFASGIFTGTDGGRFDPEGEATRAQVATIIARLLCPGQRVSHDSRQNPNMADQMGNLYNGGLCARLGDTVYYLYTEPRRDDQGQRSEYWSIIAHTDSGQSKEIYSSGNNSSSLDLLSAGPDGTLYFTQKDKQGKRNTIKQLNPKTGAVKDVYTTPTEWYVNFYLFYSGQLYVYEEKLLETSRIGRVENGRLAALVSIPYWENLYIERTMYCFGGKLCWLQLAPRDSKQDDHLMILDLDTGETAATVTDAHGFAFQGATAWSVEFTDGNFPSVLKRRSLAMPELVETICVLDGEFAQHYDNLYANGSQLYYQVSGASKLWSVSPSGQTEVIATARTPYFQASSVTSQGTVLMLNDLLSSFDSQRIDIILPDGQRTNLAAFLNKPHFLLGADQLEAEGEPAVWTPPAQDRDDTYGELLKAYWTDSGALALEVQVSNRMGKDVKMTDLKLDFSGAADGTFYLSMDYIGLADGASQMFTFVFPKGTVEVTGELADLEADLTFAGY